MNNNVIARIPINRRRNFILIRGLQGIDHAQQLCRVSPGRGRVGEDQADGFLGVDDEDGADGEGDAAGVDVGGVLVVEPWCDVSENTYL